jgi:uncharacterized protein YdaT
MSQLMKPWTEQTSPLAMRRLHPEVRAKAIEIANALLREQHDEGVAIRVGIARAQEWADSRASPRSPRDRF